MYFLENFGPTGNSFAFTRKCGGGREHDKSDAQAPAEKEIGGPTGWRRTNGGSPQRTQSEWAERETLAEATQQASQRQAVGRTRAGHRCERRLAQRPLQSL
jgi:hypothetical protein